MSDALDAILAQAAESDAKAQKLRVSMGYAVSQNPDQAAQARAVAGQLGTTQAYANENLKPLAAAATVNSFDYDGFINSYPKASEFLSDPNTAAVAHDDAPTLASIEKRFGSIPASLTPDQKEAVQAERFRVASQNQGVSGGELGSGVASATRGAFSLPSFLWKVAGTAVAGGEAALQSIKDLTVDYHNESLPDLLQRLKGEWNKPLAATLGGKVAALGSLDRFAQGQMQGPQETLQDRSGKTFTNPDYAWWGRGLVNSVESIPGAALGMAGYGGLTAPLMASEGTVNTFEQAKAEGANGAQALARGLVSGAANYALMSGGVPASPVAQSFWGKGATWLGRGAGLGLGLNAIENEAARLTNDPNRPLLQGAPESVAQMLAWEGIPFAHAVMEAGQNRAFVEGLAQDATNSKLRARMPDLFRDYVKQAANGTEVENLGIPAEKFTTFFQGQGMDPRKVAQDLQIPNFDEALAGGTDMQVPMEHFAEKIAPNKTLLDGLIDDVRVRPGDMTANEIRDHAEDLATMHKAVQGQAEQLRGQIATDPIKKGVFEGMRKQIQDAGYEPSTAEAYALAHTAWMSTMAERAGTDLAELQQKYEPRVFRTQPGESVTDAILRNAEERGGQDGGPFFQGPHAQGDFGPKFTEFQGDAKGAVGKLMETKDGEAVGALSHPDIKGPIDLIWGKEGTPEKNYEDGYGLAKIAKKHPEVLNDLQGILSGMKVKSQSDNRAVLESPDHHAVIGLRWFDDPKNWLLTEYKKEGASGSASIGSAPLADETGSSTGPDSNIGPEGGGGKTLFQPPKDMSFGSKGWQELYGLTRGAGPAAGDLALRARKGMRAALTDRGQQEFDAERALEQKTNEELFAAFDQHVKEMQAGEVHAEDNRGFMQFGEDRKMSIGLLQKADLSTIIHELGHMHVEILKDLAAGQDAPEQIKEDYQTLREFAGAKGDDPLTSEQHEKLARAEEAYMMEGKAPSEALQPVFARFKGWLQLIYQKLSNLGVKLTPEVRGVFDRMYASDQEIEQARARMGATQDLFATAKDMGVSQAEFDAYQKTAARAIDAGKEDLNQKIQSEAARERERQWNAEKDQVKEEIAARLKEDPTYQAHQALVRGELEDGTRIKLDRKQLVDRIGEDAVKAIPRGREAVYAREGGMDLDTAAELLGFKTGDDLAEALKNMEPRGEAIERLADAEMKARHGDMLTDGTVADAAVEAMHNRFREDALALELKALRAKARDAEPLMVLQRKLDAAKSKEEKAQLQQQIDEAKGKNQSEGFWRRGVLAEVPPLSTFRDAAADSIAKTPIKELMPSIYLNAQRKHSTEAFRAIAKDNYQAAADAKQMEMLNHFFYREAVRVQAEAQKIADYGKRGQSKAFQAALGMAGKSYQEQWNSLASQYEFTTVSNKELATRSLEAWAMGQEAAGHEIAIDPSLYAMRPRNWRELPITELRAVKDALKNIETIARRQNRFTANGEAMDYNDLVAKLTDTARENLTSKQVPTGGSTLSAGEKIASKAKTVNSTLLPMEQLIEWLDGGDVTGPWHQALMNRAAECQTKEHDLALRLAVPLKEAMEGIPQELKDSILDFTGIRLPGMDRDLNRKQLLSIALNRGNEQNWEKLLYGRGWTSEETQAEIGRGLAKLTAPEWAFVQSIWDAFESLRPEIGEMQQRMTGIEPEWVKAKPFVAVDEKGNQIAQLRGGYYPLVADHGESRVGMMQDIDASKGIMDSGSGYVKASTSTGYTKDRTKATYPLLLDFEQIVTQHAAKVAKDLAYREWIVDANHLLGDQRIRDTIRETLGPEYEQQFLPWLRYQANNRNGSAVQGLGAVSRWMMQLRANAVVATMGFNLATTVVQFSGITRAQHYVQGGHLMGALGEFLAHPVETTKMVRELSGEMANRGENYDRDMAGVFRGELTDSLATSSSKTLRGMVLPLMKANNEVMKFAFHGILLADVALGIPTWLGAYRQGLATHGDAARAVLEGDRAVRMTLPAAGAKDLAPIMRNDGFWKVATMYYGHFNKLYSNMADSTHQAGQMAGNGNFLGATGKVASTALLTLMIPAVMGAIFKNRGPGKDENPAEWAILESLHFASGSIPILRNIADALKTGKSGKDFKFSPMFGIFEEQTQAIMSVIKASNGEGDWSTAIFDAAAAFGHTAGIGGTTQAIKSAKYLHRVSTGEENPQNAWELAKNTALGKNPAEGGR